MRAIRKTTAAGLTPFILFLVLGIAACSKSKNTAVTLTPFPLLPEDSSNPVTLTGKVTNWLFEGDAGCFGSITDGNASIEVYSTADLCENVEVDQNAMISVNIVFDVQIQKDIGDGEHPAYTIVEFN